MANLCANLAEKWCLVYQALMYMLLCIYYLDVFNIYSQLDFSKAMFLHDPNKLEASRGKTLGNKPNQTSNYHNHQTLREVSYRRQNHTTALTQSPAC